MTSTEFDSSDDIPCFPTQKFQTETWKDVHIDELLTGRQKQEVVDLLIEFQDIFIDDTSIFRSFLIIVKGPFQRDFSLLESLGKSIRTLSPTEYDLNLDFLS
jgi:hypothetical protein